MKYSAALFISFLSLGFANMAMADNNAQTSAQNQTDNSPANAAPAEHKYAFPTPTPNATPESRTVRSSVGTQQHTQCTKGPNHNQC